MSSTTTTTTTSNENGNLITIQPTAPWVPLAIEGNIPDPYTTPKYGLEVIPLHPTFACELKGVDFSKPIPPDVYAEIREVSNKVAYFLNTSSVQHTENEQFGVIVCRNTGLTDQAHVEFSTFFGELDDVKPYIDAGRKHRLSDPRLFDAGNIDPDTNDVAPLSAAQ
jgi:alpha-ketoglutarate-dependent 2,4-dichlorophenoxyacetate dioxygenase